MVCERGLLLVLSLCFVSRLALQQWEPNRNADYTKLGSKWSFGAPIGAIKGGQVCRFLVSYKHRLHSVSCRSQRSLESL